MTKTTLALFIIIALISFFLWMEFKSYQIRSVLMTWLSQVIPTNSNQPISETKVIEPTKINKGTGDTITLSTLELKVTNSEEKETLTAKYSEPKVAKPNTKFLVITLDVKNIINEPFTDFFRDLVLEDSNWKKYLPIDSIGVVDNYLAWRNLQPWINESGIILYELPKETVSYYFTIWKKWSNDLFYVKLR